MEEKSKANLEKVTPFRKKVTPIGNATKFPSIFNAPKSQKRIRKKIYECQFCNYSTKIISNYKKHCASKKHLKKMSSQSEKVVTNLKKSFNENDYEKQLEEENTKLKEKLKDQKIKHLEDTVKLLEKQTTTNTNNNHCNNTYNINISNNAYLNDHCKDALNIENFVNGFKIQLKDLLYKSNNCLVENGLENAIQKAIMDLPANERPIHVTDHNRGNFYIKVKNKETKEDKWEINDSNGKDIAGFVSGLRAKAFCDTREEAYKNKDEIKAHDVYAPVGLSINDKPKSKNKKIIKHLAKNLPSIKDDIKELDV